MLSKESMIVAAKQFLKFGIVGVSNTLIALFIYYSLIFLNVHYIIANTAGFLVSVMNAYYWNSKYVFKKKSEGRNNSFVKSFLSYGSTFVLGTVFLFIMVHYLGISDKVAPILNLILTIPANFLLHKLWVFM